VLRLQTPIEWRGIKVSPDSRPIGFITQPGMFEVAAMPSMQELFQPQGPSRRRAPQPLPCPRQEIAEAQRAFFRRASDTSEDEDLVAGNEV
jgi:hypothetical protein